MSLYIGKKPNGITPVMHITSGVHDISDMNNAPISDTVFHSDIDVFQISNIITYAPAAPNLYSYERFVASQALTSFNNKMALMVCSFTNGDKMSSFGVIQGSSLTLWRNDGPTTTNQFQGLSFSNYSPATDWYIAYKTGVYNNSVSNVICYILDSSVDNNGIVNLASSNKINNEIIISKSILSIGGVDVFSKPILCSIPNNTMTPTWFPFPFKATTGSSEMFSSTIDGDNVSTSFYDASTGILHSGSYYGLLEKNTTDLQLYSDHVSQGLNNSTGSTIISSAMTINSLVKQFASLSYLNATSAAYPVTIIGSSSIISWYPTFTNKIIVGMHLAYNGVAGSPGIPYSVNYNSIAFLYSFPANVDYKFFTFLSVDGALNLYEAFTLYANYNSSTGMITFKFRSGDTISNVVIKLTINQFI